MLKLSIKKIEDKTQSKKMEKINRLQATTHLIAKKYLHFFEWKKKNELVCEPDHAIMKGRKQDEIEIYESLLSERGICRLSVHSKEIMIK